MRKLWDKIKQGWKWVIVILIGVFLMYIYVGIYCSFWSYDCPAVNNPPLVGTH